MSESTPDYGLIDRAGPGAGIFYPRRDSSPAPAGATDLLLEVAPGVTLGARFYATDPALPTILYFHGNGEVAGDHDDIAPLYHDFAAANLFVVDFRGYGRSGGMPSFATLVSDGPAAAARFHAILDEAGFSDRRFVMGRSLGSHPALEIAARCPGRFLGLVIESGAANLRRLADRMGVDASSGEAAALIAAHEAKIAAIRLPVLLIHGEQDELIPVAHARLLYDLLAGTERELVVIPGAGHNDLLWLGIAPYFQAIRSFVARHGA
ncbi:MAG: alpha/beta hydrolase [Chloroflexi bacterium]|nr:alpha/beta hydrolase [Chloroflexota bacterium]